MTPRFRGIRWLPLAAVLACAPEAPDPGGEPAVPDTAVQALSDSAALAATDTTAADPVQPPPDSIQDPVLRELRALGARVDSLAAAQAATLARLDPEAADSVEAAQTEPRLRYVGMRTFWSLVVIVITALAVRSLAFVIEALAERNAERRLFYKRLLPLVQLFSWIVATIIVARVVWSVDAQGLVAAGAAGAVAIGFAAQDILKNVFGGLVIVADRPFAAGDKVRVGETYGEVVSVGLWSTRITTPDDSLVSVPNSQVVNGQVSNANSGALDCQVVTDLYVPGWVDERLAKKIAYEAAAASPFVYLHKPIVVLVRDQVQPSFLTNLKVKAYVLDQRYEFRFMSDVTERARHEFRKHGLLGPYHGAIPHYRIDEAAWSEGPEMPPADDGSNTGGGTS